MSFAAKTITFQNNPVTWLQVDGAYHSGITLGDMTLLPEKPTTLTLSVSSLTAHNSSGGFDTYIGHGFNYSPEAGAAVSIEGPLVMNNHPFFTVTSLGKPAPFAFIESKADLATANAILEATQKAGFKSHFGIETTPDAK